MKRFLMWLWAIGASSCVSKSTLKDAQQQNSELTKSNETYTRYLADTKRELSKTKTEYEAFQTHTEVVLQDRDTKIADLQRQLATISQQLEAQKRAAQEQARTNEQRNAQQLQRAAELERKHNVLQQRNETIVQHLRDSMMGLDTLGVRLHSANEMVYITIPDQLIYKRDGKALERMGRDLFTKVANYLQHNADLYINVVAYSNRERDYNDNLRLANTRAINMALFLQEKGIAEQRVSTVGRVHYTPTTNAPASSSCVEVVLSIEKLF